jgi:hypothetical protein
MSSCGTDWCEAVRLPARTSAVPAVLVGQRCACGGAIGPEGECTACRSKRLGAQRQAEQPALAPAREITRTPGERLDPMTRARMEARLGHDFGQVRVHRGDRAASAAAVLGARSFALGRSIVFGAGAYNPRTETGQRLISHELTHLAQQRNAAAGGAVRLGTARGPEEREAEAVSAGGGTGPIRSGFAFPTIMRQQNPTAQLGLRIDERGRIDVTVEGPELPVVAAPTIGIRSTADGRYTLLVGGKGKTVEANEIPGLLRGAMTGSAKPGQKALNRELRVPTCGGLRTPNGARWMSFDEYRVSQMLAPDLLPLTPALYEAVVESCEPKPIEIPDQPPMPMQDLPAPNLPPGTAIA